MSTQASVQAATDVMHVALMTFLEESQTGAEEKEMRNALVCNLRMPSSCIFFKTRIQLRYRQEVVAKRA